MSLKRAYSKAVRRKPRKTVVSDVGIMLSLVTKAMFVVDMCKDSPVWKQIGRQEFSDDTYTNKADDMAWLQSSNYIKKKNGKKLNEEL